MKKILIIGGFLMALVHFSAQSIAPTDTKNYIYTKDCLDAECIKKSETVQYFDGLGRTKQIVGIKASPGQNDVVSHIEYDPDGRISKSYLPVPQNGTQNGAFYENPLNNATDPEIYGSEKIYSKQILENLPLARVKEAYSVGNAWFDKPVRYTYSTNTSGSEVKRYATSTTWIENRTESQLNFPVAYYPVNTVTKTIITDEDNNVTTEYRNGKRQVILIRKNDGTHNLDTYYVYNEYDELIYVIPPAASTLDVLDESKRNSLCYQYRYDDFGRLVEKKVPGKGWEYLVYDKQNRVALYQDSSLGTIENNFGAKGWMFTKYDKFGRVVYTGFFANTASRSLLQVEIDNISDNSGNNEERSVNSFKLNGMDIFYTKNAFPKENMTLLSVNYYDTYPMLPDDVSIPSQILGQDILTPDAQNTSVSTKALPTATFIKNIEDNNWTKDFIWYDMKGRIVGSHSINHLGGSTKTESLLDFAGIIQKNETYHIRKKGENGVTVKERYVYDLQNRLVKHYHQVDNKGEELLTENNYNELAELKNKKIGNNIQSIDYSYNIRGWLTDVNKEQMEIANMDGKLFTYKIKYNQKQGIENPDPVLFPNKNVVAKYNGNISEVDWRSIETIGINPSLIPKRYGYVYDKLNRLSAGYYQNPDNPYSKENTESIDYDFNGNITDIYRTANADYGTNTATLIDKLKYDYNGNQVTHINDYAYNQTGYEGGGATIEYDINGNVIQIPDKGITTIKYNHLNLPNFLHLNRYDIEDISVKTTYSADGKKLRKENTTVVSGITGSTVTKGVVDYLDGFQYSKTDAPNSGGGDPEMFSARAMQPQVFSVEAKGVSPVAGKTPDLQFFATSEGFYDYVNDQYIYQLKDHVGNVRVSFAKSSLGNIQLKDNNDYYPFGMNHLKTGNAYFGVGSYVKYKFGGKELQEFGGYDFGARTYMPDIGRWFAIDPLAEKNPNFSPYRYGFNNPIMFSDPNGMLELAAMAAMFEYAGTWYNTGSGFTNSSALKSIDYDGNFINWSDDYTNSLLAGIGVSGGGGSSDSGGSFEIEILIPQVALRGKHFQWGQAYHSAFVSYMEKWNAKSDFQWDRWNSAGRRNDGPIKYMGGAGDPFAIFEGLGIILSHSDNPNMNLAAFPILIMSRNGDDALKLLAVEKELLKAEAKIISKEAVAANGTLTTGPFAGEGIPATNGHSRAFTAAQREALREQGSTLGCHTCGQTNPGTKSGNFILDHQPANALVPDGWPQTLYPHCKYCSANQGGILSGMKRQGVLPKITK